MADGPDLSTWRPDLAAGYLEGQAGAASIARRRKRNLAITIPIVLLALIVVAVEVRSIWLFRAITPWSKPGKIHYCGQDYLPEGSPQPGSELNVIHLTKVMWGPFGQPVDADKLNGPAAEASGCPTELYMKHGSRYQRYWDGIAG